MVNVFIGQTLKPGLKDFAHNLYTFFHRALQMNYKPEYKVTTLSPLTIKMNLIKMLDQVS